MNDRIKRIQEALQNKRNEEAAISALVQNACRNAGVNLVNLVVTCPSPRLTDRDMVPTVAVTIDIKWVEV